MTSYNSYETINKLIDIIKRNRNNLTLEEEDKEYLSRVFNGETFKFKKNFKNIKNNYFTHSDIEAKIRDCIYLYAIFSINIYESGNTWRNEEWIETCYSIEVEGILREGYTLEDLEKSLEHFFFG